MLIRGADGRLYEVTSSGLDAVSEPQKQSVSARVSANADGSDNMSNAHVYEPPFPPSFP